MGCSRRKYTTNHYLGRKGKRYAEAQQPANSPGGKLNAEFFQPFISSEDVVLDFGCGKGAIASHVLCKRIDGFDVNLEALKSASGCFSETFSTYDQPPNAFYDVIYSNHALEHVPSPMEVLKKVSEWLRPDGRAVFIVPHDCVRARHQREFHASDPVSHLYTWTPRTLGNLFIQAGFEVQTCRVLNSAWVPQLFRIHQMPIIGPLSRRFVCYLKHRAQVLCVSRKPR